MLRKLKTAIAAHQQDIEQALFSDLGKSAPEAFLTEIALVNLEIDYHIKHIRKWSKPKSVAYSLSTFPSRAYVKHEPLGVVLIMAPWNYPFQLLINPLIGAISAGNCAVLKPSPLAPATAILVEKIIQANFAPEYISVVQGDIPENQALLEQRFDLIFFTGSTRVGKLIMQAAAKNLIPVVLELGGKSPAIVSNSANLNIALRRIIWGKLVNSGQTCVAPDYVILERGLKSRFISAFKDELQKLYGANPIESKWYPKLISEGHYQRLEDLIANTNILFESARNKASLKFGPVLVDMPASGHPLAEEELFGPVLPILELDSIDEAITYVNQGEKPLALYFFGSESEGNRVVNQTSSGGACINETIVHLANHHLPFGGVGQSGMGSYHGRESFKVFSHKKALIKGSVWLDPPFRYPPFKFIKWLKKFL
ncbi:aldehyde dehydrogenase [Bacteroidota bacterium]